ncbi:hypothetical protein M2263_000148 [Providencia alcalifaciens]|nr:hypothetical protein [Providencia alcalifaciens]
MKNEAEAFMSALVTLKLCWTIHKSNDAVSACAGMLKRKFVQQLAYESMRTIEISSNPMLVITLAEWEIKR